MRGTSQDTDSTQYWDAQRRLERLENPTIESFHLVGDALDTFGVVFQNGWLNFDNGLATPTAGQRNAGFYLHDHRVYLDGLIKSGTVGTVPVFTLPERYRPLTQKILPAITNGALGVVTVQVDGTVWCFSGSNIYFDISSVSFRHADG